MGLVNITADLTGPARALGQIEGFAAVVESQYAVDTMVKKAWADSSSSFNRFMDRLAVTEPKRYHHVYEWGMIGIPEGQLWRHRLNGRGGMRTATFEFVTSKTYVPEPNYIEPEQQAKLSGRRYKFPAKAFVMEFGIPVNIKPRKPGGKLFIPFPEGSEYDPAKKYIFADEVTNPRPGGDVAGNFTQTWLAYMQSTGEAIVNLETIPEFTREMTPFATPASTVVPRTAKLAKRSFKLEFAAARTLSETKTRTEIAKLSRAADAEERWLSRGG